MCANMPSFEPAPCDPARAWRHCTALVDTTRVVVGAGRVPAVWMAAHVSPWPVLSVVSAIDAKNDLRTRCPTAQASACGGTPVEGGG